MALLPHSAAALSTAAFKKALLLNVMLALVFNLLLPLVAGSAKRPRHLWQGPLDVNVGFDTVLSHVLTGVLTTWFGTGGAAALVRDGSLPPLAPAVLRRLPWRHTPAAIASLLLRGVAMGAATLLLAPPLFLATFTVWRGAPDVPGLWWVLSKGLYISFVATPPVYVLVFLAAIANVAPAPAAQPAAASLAQAPPAEAVDKAAGEADARDLRAARRRAQHAS